MICFSAVSLVFLSKKYGNIIALLFLGLILLTLINHERRAGFILVLLSALASLYIKKIRIVAFITPIIVGLLVYAMLQSNVVENMLYNNSPRIYELLYENKKLKATDQSYLVRRAQVEKGLTIFSEHPLTGIGLNNFVLYSVQFQGNFEGAELVINKEGLDNISSHNSYINLLAEGGLLIIIPFALLLLYNLFHFIKSYNKRSQIENAFYWSFIGMCIHLYFISEIVNVFAWFLIGIVSALSVTYSKVRARPNRLSVKKLVA